MELPRQPEPDRKRSLPQHGLSGHSSCRESLVRLLPEWWLMSLRVFKFSKLFNYMQREVATTITFAGLVVAWTYFRIYLNLNILWSVWFEFDLIPYAVSFLPSHMFSSGCVQGRVYAVGTRNRSLARMVDEISDFHPSVPPAALEPLLVFLNLTDLSPVRRTGFQYSNRAEM